MGTASINEEIKNALRNDLRYTEQDLLYMRPEIARMVFHHKLARPIEGMPKNWYRNKEKDSTDNNNIGKRLRRSLLSSKKKRKVFIVSIAATVGVTAAMSTSGVLDKDILEDLIDDVKDYLQEIPKAIAALF